MMGRIKGSGGQFKVNTMIRLNQGQHDRVTRLADFQGISFSQFCREALEAYVGGLEASLGEQLDSAPLVERTESKSVTVHAPVGVMFRHEGAE